MGARRAGAIVNTVGKRIAHARERKGWTQMDLCRAVDIGQSTLSVLESGNGSSKHLLAISRALGVSVEWLTEGRGPMKAPISQAAARAMIAALRDCIAALALSDPEQEHPMAQEAIKAARAAIAKAGGVSDL